MPQERRRHVFRGGNPAASVKPAASPDPSDNSAGNRGTTRCARRAPNRRLTAGGTKHRRASEANSGARLDEQRRSPNIHGDIADLDLERVRPVPDQDAET